MRGKGKAGNSIAEPAGQGSVLEDVISLQFFRRNLQKAYDVYNVINSQIFILTCWFHLASLFLLFIFFNPTDNTDVGVDG